MKNVYMTMDLYKRVDSFDVVIFYLKSMITMYLTVTTNLGKSQQSESRAARRCYFPCKL